MNNCSIELQIRWTGKSISYCCSIHSRIFREKNNRSRKRNVSFSRGIRITRIPPFSFVNPNMHPRGRLTYESYSNTFPSTIRFEEFRVRFSPERDFIHKNSKSLRNIFERRRWKDAYIFTKIIIHENLLKFRILNMIM